MILSVYFLKGAVTVSVKLRTMFYNSNRDINPTEEKEGLSISGICFRKKQQVGKQEIN